VSRLEDMIKSFPEGEDGQLSFSKDHGMDADIFMWSCDLYQKLGLHSSQDDNHAQLIFIRAHLMQITRELRHLQGKDGQRKIEEKIMRKMHQVNPDIYVDLYHVVAVHPRRRQSVIVLSEGGQDKYRIFFDDSDGKLRREVISEISNLEPA